MAFDIEGSTMIAITMKVDLNQSISQSINQSMLSGCCWAL